MTQRVSDCEGWTLGRRKQRRTPLPSRWPQWGALGAQVSRSRRRQRNNDQEDKNQRCRNAGGAADGHGDGLYILVAVQQVLVEVLRICLGFHMRCRFVGELVIVVLGMEVQAQQSAGQESHGNNRQKGTAKSHGPSISGTRPRALHGVALVKPLSVEHVVAERVAAASRTVPQPSCRRDPQSIQSVRKRSGSLTRRDVPSAGSQELHQEARRQLARGLDPLSRIRGVHSCQHTRPLLVLDMYEPAFHRDDDATAAICIDVWRTNLDQQIVAARA